MSYYSNYRWCAVPKCKNTSVKTPGKLWIHVPHDKKMRKVWFEVAGRDPEVLSERSVLYLCEDHFDLETDMENYTQYKIMGSVKKVRMKPQCIPSRFNCNIKHEPDLNESQLAEANRPKKSTSIEMKIEVDLDVLGQDHSEQDIINVSSPCIQDSHITKDVPSMVNKCDKTVQVCHIQEHKETQVVLSQKHKAIQVCRKAPYRSKEVQTYVKSKDSITSPIKFKVSTATSPLKICIKNTTKPSKSQSTISSRRLCFIRENCDSDTSCTPCTVGSNVDHDYTPYKKSYSNTTLNTSCQAKNKTLEKVNLQNICVCPK